MFVTGSKKHQALRLVAAILVEVVHEVYDQHRGPFSYVLGVSLGPHGEVSKQDLTNSIDALKAEIEESKDRLRIASDAIGEINGKLRTASSLTQEQATQIEELGRRLVKSHAFTEQLQASYNEHNGKEYVKHCLTFELVKNWKQKAQRLASDLNESRQEVERLSRNFKGGKHGVNAYRR